MSERILYTTTLFVFIIYVTVFVISPMNGEDYALIANNYESIFDIFHKMYLQATNWNARLGELLAIFMLSINRYIYIVISSIVFFCFCNLVAKIAVPEVTMPRFTRFCVAVVLIFTFWPLYELFFWRTVNAGYFFPITIYMFLLFRYIKTSCDVSKIELIITTVAAFICGLSFENAPVVIAIIMISILFLQNKIKIYRLWYPIVAVIFGWALLMLAPSTRLRVLYYNKIYGTGDITISYLVTRISDVLDVFILNGWFLLLMYLIGSLYFVCKKDRYGIFLSKLCFVGFAILVVTVFSPYTEARAFLLLYCLMFLVFIRFSMLICKYRFYHVFLYIVVLIFGYNSIKLIDSYESFARYINFRDVYIKLDSVNDLYCFDGLEYERRFLNNREEWVRGSYGHMKNFYGKDFVYKEW